MANIFGDIWNQFKKRTVTQNGRRIFYPFGTPQGSTGNTAGNIGTNTAQTKVNQNVFGSNPWSDPAPSYADPNINLHPVATTMYDRPAGPPAPKTKPPVTSIPNYEQDRINYEKNKGISDTALAQQAEEEARRKAQEDYDLEKGSLNSQLSNLTSALSSYKTNRNADVNAYNQTVERGKENARTASGSTQRTLAKTRQDQLNQNQKTYAALGTVDSYGVGSFTQANANDESDFLRMTNENYKNLEDKLYTLDQDALSYKRKADMDIAEQESQFNSAVIEINRLLQGNENMKRQALQAATQLLAEKKAGIKDNLDKLMLQIENEKYTSAKALDAEKAKSATMKADYDETSTEFQTTKQPKDAADWWFIQKYPDVYKSMTSQTNNTQQKSATKVSGIIGKLKDMDTKGITGLIRTQITDNDRSAAGLLKQLSSELQIEEAKRLKGQGTMSDYERNILADSIAAFNLDENGLPQVSDTRFREILNELDTGINTSQNASQNASQNKIRVQDKKTGEYGFIPPNEFDPNLYNRA